MFFRYRCLANGVPFQTTLLDQSCCEITRRIAKDRATTGLSDWLTATTFGEQSAYPGLTGFNIAAFQSQKAGQEPLVVRQNNRAIADLKLTARDDATITMTVDQSRGLNPRPCFTAASTGIQS